MNSIIGWVGGKRQLRKEIIELFPPDIKMYVEVFGGAGWVLLGKEKHAQDEIYNDFNSDLVNLFRCIKYHPDELKKELKPMIPSRENFNNYREMMRIEGFTDIQKASMFFSTIKYSFGSKGTSFATRGRNFQGAVDGFDELSKRLNKVVIENKDFEDLIKLYDGKETFFYLDPPYYKTEKYYNTQKEYFMREDHNRLKNVLKNIEGKFLLSYNDCEEIRQLYSEFGIISVNRKETLSSNADNRKDYKEILIKNY